jgi:hypothetical protein
LKNEDETIDNIELDVEGEQFHGLIPAQTQDVKSINF